MKEYIKILRKQIDYALSQCCLEAADSPLDALYQHYDDNLKGDSDYIKGQFQQLNDLLCDLSIREQDLVVDIVCRLCGAYQRDAYKDGVVTGFYLYQQLSVVEESVYTR